jgi:hypothetical protein
MTGFEEGGAAAQEIGELYARLMARLEMLSHDDGKTAPRQHMITAGGS